VTEREPDPPAFDVERLTRDERTRQFRGSVIADVQSEPNEVKAFVVRAFVDRCGVAA